jgi:NTP pyrophosphatase (non-canonical NTP hydrolase)
MFSTAMFLDTMDNLQKNINAWAIGKGFWGEGQDNFGQKLALIHSELSEALEAHRANESPTDVYGKKFALNETQWWSDDGNAEHERSEKYCIPEGVGIELADAVIRILDLCEHLKIDLARCILDKMAYNQKREHKHGKIY